MFSTAILLVGLLALFKQGECVTFVWVTPLSGTATATKTQAEGTAASTAVATLAATPTPAGTPTYALVSCTGVFSLATAAMTNTAKLDYETQSVYLVIVTATDTDVSTATVTVSVTDVTTDPVFGTLSYYARVDDNAAAGTTIGTYSATDSDTTSLTYAIGGGNTGTVFAVSSAGLLTVATSKTLYGTNVRSYMLLLNAHDGTQTATTTVTVCVGSTSQCASGSSSGASAVSGCIMTTLFALCLGLLR